jgi:hypothetical protein
LFIFIIGGDYFLFFICVDYHCTKFVQEKKQEDQEGQGGERPTVFFTSFWKELENDEKWRNCEVLEVPREGNKLMEMQQSLTIVNQEMRI